jgi:hypothetical protein
MTLLTKIEIMGILGLIGWFLVSRMRVIMFITPATFIIGALIAVVVFMWPTKK